MDKIKFREMVKAATDKLKDETVCQMLQSDSVYQEDSEKESEAERSYMLLDLTEEQREVCDQLFHCKDSQDFEYGTHAYMAGIYDAFRMIAVLFPERWKLEEIKEVLFPKE